MGIDETDRLEVADKLGVAKSTIARWEIDQVKASPLAVARIKELEGAKK